MSAPHITHVYTTSHSTHQETFAHFDATIIAVSGFYTPDDQMQHAIVALADFASGSFQTSSDVGTRDSLIQGTVRPHGGGGAGYYLQEIVFQLGSPIPPARLLGLVAFPFVDIGAYVKPDSVRRVIIVAPTGNPSPQDTQLYLGSYSPGREGFTYDPWPPLKLWPHVPPTITSFHAQPNQIFAGDTATLNWQIALGAYDGVVVYHFDIDGKDGSGMLVFHFHTLDFVGSTNVNPMSTTTYTLTASVRGADDPDFISRSQQLQVTVTPKPPPTPANLGFANTYYTDESGNALPHLYANDPFIAHFIVGNAGGTATGPFKVIVVRDNNVQSITIPIANLAPGQITDVYWNFSSGLPSGSYGIVATLDPEGVVKESPGPRVGTLGIIIDSR